jgi:hypothetical protein
MRSQAVLSRDIHHPHTGLKALGYNPGLHIIWPASISPRSRHNLNEAVKPIPAIRHQHLLLNTQRETRRSISVTEPWKSMGQGRRLRLFPSVQYVSDQWES